MKKKTALLISIFLFVLSLTQPAYYTESSQPDNQQSIMLLLIGWSGTLMGGAGICWLANPLLFLSWSYVLKEKRASIFTSFFATVFALLFLAFNTIIINEASTSSPITERKAGYWLWLSSISFCFVSTTCMQMFSHKPNVTSDVINK